MAKLLRERIPTSNDIRTVNRSLLLLARAGFVHRLKYLDLANDGVGYACGLTDKGAEEFGGKSFDDHVVRTLDHELEISYFHIWLQRFCNQDGLTLYWQQSDLKKCIHPDAYFSITDPKKEGKNTNHFFLEIERQRMGRNDTKDGKPSIIKKLDRYYHTYNTDQCETDWGFKSFRVVTLLESEARRTNLLKAIELKHRMYWIGVKAIYTDFRTPKDDTLSFADL